MTHSPSLSPWSTRIYFDDTDAGGVVYHGRYLAHFERARNDQFLAIGFDHLAHLKETGECFVVVRIEVDYKKPARLGDSVLIETTVMDMSSVRVTLHQEMKRDDVILAKATVAIVWVGKNEKGIEKAKSMPIAIKNLLQKFLQKAP